VSLDSISFKNEDVLTARMRYR